MTRVTKYNGSQKERDGARERERESLCMSENANAERQAKQEGFSTRQTVDLAVDVP